MSSVGSENGQSDRLEPHLLRAAENNDLDTLAHIIDCARENGQFSDNFLRVGLIRSSLRGRVEATHYLLRLGAKADVPNTDNNATGNRPSPLMRAVEHNQVQITQMLLDHGASPETTDRKGRTALMAAAWKNHWHVLALLIARGANVNAKDHKRRNVLHNLAADKLCNWGDDVIRLLLGTVCAIDDPEGQDELGRTPLHWACATGKLRLAEMLLTRTRPGPAANVNGVELRNKTALHIAAAHKRDDIVQLLLRHRADIEARSDGGWTALHNACVKGSASTVCILLEAGANVNSQLLNGVTPLHLAAQEGHREVVECLLQRGDLKRRVRDNFGSTPFLRAAQFRRKDIVFLLAPFNNTEALSPDAKGACEGFRATVVDFGNFHNENRVQKMSVYELLYRRDLENPRKQAFHTVPADNKATDFRWIHLPANNMAWVEALLTKVFIEEGLHDVDGFKGLEKSLNYQHRGQWTHSHFMRPMCQSTPRASRFRDDESGSDERSEISFTPSSPDIVGPLRNPRLDSLHYHHSNHQRSSSKSKNQKAGKLDRANSDGAHHKRKGSVKSGDSAPGTPRLEQKSKFPFGRDERHSSFSRDSASNVCIFMPYLHFETVERRERMQEAIQRAEMFKRRPPAPHPIPPVFSTNPPQPGITRAPTRDEMLVNAHLASSSTSLHVRRTLDQFFYPNIDTRTRDQDQVVYRYQTKSQYGHWMEPKIFMVDQLWMWILGPSLIVTCFAQRWEQPKNDPLNVLDGIIEDINSKTHDPISSVYELAIAITNRCCGIFDRHRMGDEEYQFLDMFESAIGIATDRETMLFQEFNVASAQASDWLKNHRKLNRFARNLQKEDRRESDELWFLGSGNLDEEEPLFVDKLLDIGQETDLLTEAKDVRDELNMIRTILHHQSYVLVDFQEVISEMCHGQQRSRYEVKKRFKDQQRTIDMHLKDIDRMDKQAERIYSSITDLLDLKQKHANAFEARFARDQAAGTTRQGKIILVFTVVTIIFLPLSFIASIFDISIAEFPKGPDGQEELHLSYVAKYTFGIGFAISVPLIALALSADDIGDGCQEAVRRVRRWLTLRRIGKYGARRQQIRRQSIQQQPPWPVIEPEGKQGVDVDVETILGKSTGRLGRRSVDTEYGGSLLPISSRGTGRTRMGVRMGMGMVNRPVPMSTAVGEV